MGRNRRRNSFWEPMLSSWKGKRRSTMEVISSSHTTVEGVKRKESVRPSPASKDAGWDSAHHTRVKKAAARANRQRM